MRIIFFGPPGAGKGTQAAKLSSYLKVPHLSTGEILRSQIEAKDELSLKLKEILSSGKLVSDEIINKIVTNKLLSSSCKNGFILDGVPRTIQQYEFLNSFLDKNQISLNSVINIYLDEKIIENRIISRSKVEKRDDDSLAIIRTRINLYNNETKAVAEFYKKKQPNIFFEINGDQNIDKIHSDILEITKNADF